jgi:hypothetical protein
VLGWLALCVQSSSRWLPSVSAASIVPGHVLRSERENSRFVLVRCHTGLGGGSSVLSVMLACSTLWCLRPYVSQVSSGHERDTVRRINVLAPVVELLRGGGGSDGTRLCIAVSLEDGARGVGAVGYVPTSAPPPSTSVHPLVCKPECNLPSGFGNPCSVDVMHVLRRVVVRTMSQAISNDWGRVGIHSTVSKLIPQWSHEHSKRRPHDHDCCM